MFKPKISVIMAVYNTEDYLEETLMSVLNQTMIDDIEVLMIDDGSTDNSRYIIEKYALDYENFHAFHKENEGQGIARNYGLKFAKGEYIHFLDSDDYLPPKAYETLYGMANKNNDDIAIGNVSRFALNNVWDDILFKNSYNKLSDNVESTNLHETPLMLWDTITCNKLYNKQFLTENNILFLDEKIFFEDILFSLKSYIFAKSISITTDEIYYWRLRSDESSTTQQDLKVTNFKDRLKILRLCNELLEKHDIEDEIKNFEYFKWLNHDLKFFLKRIDKYPKEHHNELIDEVYNLIKLVPMKLFDELNSYQKTLYKLILNKDYENIILFAPLENELYEHPHIPSFLDGEYKQYFNFYKDVEGEELNVELTEVTHDDSSIFLEVKGSIYYLSHEQEYNIKADLIYGNEEHPLEYDELNNKLIIPFDLLQNKNHVQIKITYQFESFEKNAYLKNKHKNTISLDNFSVDIGFGKNSIAFFDYVNKKDNKIDIFDMSLVSNNFIFKGKSDKIINQMSIRNVISFEKHYYPVEYNDDSLEFTFSIPYEDILNSVVKKWELNCEDSFNNISLKNTFHFFSNYYEYIFCGVRDKIFIFNQIYHPIDSLNNYRSEKHQFKNENKALKKKYKKLDKKYNKLEKKIEKLTEKNKTLKKDNSRLEKKLEEFKSRKGVKLLDKLKF